MSLLVETLDGAVLTLTVDAPPINVMTAELFGELSEVVERLATDPDGVRVVVFASANPEFFIAHYDVANIVSRPVDTPAERRIDLKPFHVMCERVRTMPVVSLVKLAGRVGGGGSEFSASCDMRFGVLGRTVVNQMEVPIGILPGGTGTQRLPRLMGRGRALEVILGGVDLDAATAERWGYLNRAFASVGELDGYVDGLARRIASFPPAAVAMAKAAVNGAEPPWTQGLINEAYLFDQTLRTPEAPVAMRRFLDGGGQTREGELEVGEVNRRINEGAPWA